MRKRCIIARGNISTAGYVGPGRIERKFDMYNHRMRDCLRAKNLIDYIRVVKFAFDVCILQKYRGSENSLPAETS